MSRGLLFVFVAVLATAVTVSVVTAEQTKAEATAVCSAGYYRACHRVHGKRVCHCKKSDILKMLQGGVGHHLKQAKIHHHRWKHHVKKARQNKHRAASYAALARHHKKKADYHRKKAQHYSSKAKQERAAAKAASQKAKAAAKSGKALPATVAALKAKAKRHWAAAKRNQRKAQLHAELQASYTTKYYTSQQAAEIQKSQAMAHNLMANSELKLYNSAMAQWRKLTSQEAAFNSQATLYSSKSKQNHQIYVSSDAGAKKYRTRRDAEQKKVNAFAAAVAKWGAKRAAHLAAMKAAQSIMQRHLQAAQAAQAQVAAYKQTSAKAKGQEKVDMVSIKALKSAIAAAKQRLAKAQATYDAHHKAYVAAHKLVQMYQKRVNSNTVVANKAKTTATAQGSAAANDLTQYNALSLAQSKAAAKRAKDELARKNLRIQASHAQDKYNYWKARATAAKSTARFYHKLAVQQHGYAVKYHGKWRTTKRRAAAAAAKAKKYSAEAAKYQAKLNTHSARKTRDRAKYTQHEAAATQAEVAAEAQKITVAQKLRDYSHAAAAARVKAKKGYKKASAYARIARKHRKQAKHYDAAYQAAQKKAKEASKKADTHLKKALANAKAKKAHVKTALKKAGLH